jgi:pimeloyl-ACP methyl ester carboxylesterase
MLGVGLRFLSFENVIIYWECSNSPRSFQIEPNTQHPKPDIKILRVGMHFCVSWSMRQKITDKQLEKFFTENNLPGSIHYYNKLGRDIRYIYIGDHKPASLFFIPGSPASVDLYIDFYKDPELLRYFNMYSVDRPGYGNSGYGKPEPSIQKQAEMIRPIIDGLNTVTRPLIICAGSYGASIACRLVMDHPRIADGLVLHAPSLAPGMEKKFWITPIIEHSFLRYLAPPHHRSANTEKVHHRKELRKMLPYWKNIRIPVTYIQGEKDGMVYKSNADFAREKMVNVPSLDIHFIPGREHFITRKERPFITSKIIEMLKKIGSQKLAAIKK